MDGLRTRASEDISGKIGPLHPWAHEAEWPMESFNRPSWAFFQGIAEGLAQLGRKEPEIQEILQSKYMRWLFDGQAHVELHAIGKNMALSYGKEWNV